MREVCFPIAAAVAALFVAAPVAAQYVAVPAAKPAAKKLPLQGVVWRCGEYNCAADRTTSRPDTVCAAFVRKVGRVSSFTAAGAPLDPTALEKCNQSAKN
ncbi:CC_3452 family protein [Allosphingosinicella vermicomposti]|uniref:CC_3452 family protein n=1 Tax=Allosphingosinicella vermicomposti TaxID=614671 RepID=UPI000D0ECDF0